MISEYGLPVIFLQAQQQTDWPMFAATMAASLAAFLAIAVTLYIYRDSKKPSVIVYLHKDTDTRVMYLIVKNVGQGVAYDISIEVSSDFYIDERKDIRGLLTSGFLGRGISMLPPGEHRETYIAGASEFAENMGDNESVAYVSYARKYGGRKCKQIEFVLDSYSFRTLYTDSYEKEISIGIKHIAKGVCDIAKTQKSHTAKLMSGSPDTRIEKDRPAHDGVPAEMGGVA